MVWKTNQDKWQIWDMGKKPWHRQVLEYWQISENIDNRGQIWGIGNKPRQMLKYWKIWENIDNRGHIPHICHFFYTAGFSKTKFYTQKNE